MPRSECMSIVSNFYFEDGIHPILFVIATYFSIDKQTLEMAPTGPRPNYLPKSNSRRNWQSQWVSARPLMITTATRGSGPLSILQSKNLEES